MSVSHYIAVFKRNVIITVTTAVLFLFSFVQPQRNGVVYERPITEGRGTETVNTWRRATIGVIVGADNGADSTAIAALMRGVDAVNDEILARDGRGGVEGGAHVLLDTHIIRLHQDHDVVIGRTICQSLYKAGVLVLFSPSPASSSLLSFSRAFHLPHITTSSLNDVISTPQRHSQPDIQRPEASQRWGESGAEELSGSESGDEQTYSLSLRPVVDKALIDVIHYYRWKKIIFLYDTIAGLTRLERIQRSGLNLNIESLYLRDISDCYTSLRRVDQWHGSDDKYIILDIYSDTALSHVLRQIQNLGMTRMNYHYLLTTISMSELDLTLFIHGGVNVTGFNLIHSSDVSFLGSSATLHQSPIPNLGYQGQSSVDESLIHDTVLVINSALQSALFDYPDLLTLTHRRGHTYNASLIATAVSQCKQATPTTFAHGPIIMRHLKQAKLEGLTGMLSFNDQGLRIGYTLAVVELSVDTEQTQIGTWNDRTGLNITNDPDGSRSKGAHGNDGPGCCNRTRIVTSILSHPYLMERKSLEDGKLLYGNDRFHGYCADLASEISKIVRFDYELRLVKDGMYGVANETGHWNGMVGELTRLEADMAIAPLTITSTRERVIDFSKPFMDLGISIMIKKPEKQKPGVFSFMDPLSTQIWLCIAVSYVGVSLILFLVSRFSPYEWLIDDRVNQDGPGFTNDFTILNSLWFSLGAFMRQGCDISPRSISGRVVGSAWWFFTLIIISSYTANLAAFLTVERMLTPIESADDLAKQREIQYGTLEAGSTRDFFKLSKIPTYERMWEFMSTAQPSMFVTKTLDGVMRVRSSKGKYAFLLESTMNEYYNQRKPCDTMKVGGNLDAKGYGIATPIGSDIRESISLAVLSLLETGVLQKFHKKWWYDKGECGHDDGKAGGTAQSALTLSNVAGIFYILITGLGLSMIISLLEYLYKSRQKAKRQKYHLSGPSRIIPQHLYLNSTANHQPHTQV